MIRRIVPGVEIVDVTHGIPRHAVTHGAVVLRNTLPYVPAGVHVAVVDPQVGTERRAVALRCGDGRILVGPANGLLSLAWDEAGGVELVVDVSRSPHRLEPVSATFHGRDVFAPVAAHLAAGIAPEEVGPPVDPAALVRLDLPAAEVGAARARVTVLYVDRYGNVQVNATSDDLARAGMQPGAQVEIDVGFERYFATVATTFADVGRGDILVYEDSYGNVAVAINGGDAADMLSARPGEELRIRLVA